MVSEPGNVNVGKFCIDAIIGKSHENATLNDLGFLGNINGMKSKKKKKTDEALVKCSHLARTSEKSLKKLLGRTVVRRFLIGSIKRSENGGVKISLFLI